MRILIRLSLAGAVCVLPPVPAGAATDDPFEFFREEAQVVTASRQPQRRDEASATVCVVSSQDLQDSGARTLWDALRAVPGVEVAQSRTGHAEVGIRGLNEALNKRTLVLLDGKTALDGFYDFVM